MNFIIYEDDSSFVKTYRSVINRIMGGNKINYNVFELNSFNDYLNLDNNGVNKVYIFDIEVPGKTGIELAKKIRKDGDWSSPIILVSNHIEFQNIGYTKNLLMLDFILKDINIYDNLYGALNIALEINSSKKTFCFSKRGELFQIPYQDILYIEKNINDNCSMIVTKGDSYQIRETIQNLEKEFSDSEFFFKSHRSYLVNLNNIKHIDFDVGEITFSKNGKALVSRSNKKKLKERMYN